MMKNNLRKVADMTVTALVHHLTPTVVEALPELGYKPMSKGILQRDSDMVSYLIVFEDLPDEVVPEELQTFSNSMRRQTVILSELARERSSPILEAIFELYESEVLKLMAIKQETIERFVKNLGQEKILATLQKEDILKTLSKEDFLAALSKEDFLAALSKEDFLAALSKEDFLAALSKEELLAALSKEDMFNKLLVELGAEQLRKMIDQSGRN